MNGPRLAFTTDSLVVTPIFFPGGNIGRLAINGMANYLAISGARLPYIAAAFIVEEGLATKDLRQVVDSMPMAANQAGVLLLRRATGFDRHVLRGEHQGIDGRRSAGFVGSWTRSSSPFIWEESKEA